MQQKSYLISITNINDEIQRIQTKYANVICP